MCRVVPQSGENDGGDKSRSGGCVDDADGNDGTGSWRNDAGRRTQDAGRQTQTCTTTQTRTVSTVPYSTSIIHHPSCTSSYIHIHTHTYTYIQHTNIHTVPVLPLPLPLPRRRSIRHHSPLPGRSMGMRAMLEMDTVLIQRC